MNWRKLLLALGPIPVVGACLLAACGGDSSPTGPGPDGGAAMKDLRGVSVGQNARFAWDERVVTDRETGLVWQRAAEDRWLSWREANERCAALGEGWRLPTREELLGLIGTSDTGPLRDVSEDWFWSASPSATRDGAAWTVAVGGFTNTNLESDRGRARCVR